MKWNDLDHIFSLKGDMDGRWIAQRQELGLERFLNAQKGIYEKALNEIKDGKKLSHWIWYVFPQLRGLGKSYNSVYYGIKDLEEAAAYWEHPILGNRLRSVTQAFLSLKTQDAVGVFGSLDALKVCSCMTLFNECTDEEIFSQVLEKYYHGKKDERTLRILGRNNR